MKEPAEQVAAMMATWHAATRLGPIRPAARRKRRVAARVTPSVAAAVMTKETCLGTIRQRDQNCRRRRHPENHCTKHGIIPLLVLAPRIQPASAQVIAQLAQVSRGGGLDDGL